jgi:hypothetical protein
MTSIWVAFLFLFLLMSCAPCGIAIIIFPVAVWHGVSGV